MWDKVAHYPQAASVLSTVCVEVLLGTVHNVVHSGVLQGLFFIYLMR